MPMPVKRGNFRVLDQRVQPESFDRVRPGIFGQVVAFNRRRKIRYLRKGGLGASRRLSRRRKWIWIRVESRSARRQQIDRSRDVVLPVVAMVGVINVGVHRLPRGRPYPLDKVTLQRTQLWQVDDRMNHP